MDDVGRQGCAREALGLVWVMQKAVLQREQALLAHLDPLHDLALLPVPKGQRIPVRTAHDILHFEPLHIVEAS